MSDGFASNMKAEHQVNVHINNKSILHDTNASIGTLLEGTKSEMKA